jgi:hypothetical protein
LSILAWDGVLEYFPGRSDAERSLRLLGSSTDLNITHPDWHAGMGHLGELHWFTFAADIRPALLPL